MNKEYKRITPEEEYQYRYKQRTQKEIELSKKYNCDGLCYGNTFMCPCVETCPETKGKEGFATLLASIVYILLCLSPLFVILMFILICIWR